MSLARAGRYLTVVALVAHAIFLIAAAPAVVFGVPFDLRRSEWQNDALPLIYASIFGGTFVVAGCTFGLAAYRRYLGRWMSAATAAALFLLAGLASGREQPVVAGIEFALAILSFLVWEDAVEPTKTAKARLDAP